MKSSTDIADYSGLRDRIDRLGREPGRDYKAKLTKCISYVKWHLNELDSYLKAKDQQIQKYKDILGQDGQDPWVRVSTTLPPLGERLLFWDDEYCTYEAAKLNQNSPELQTDDQLRAFLKENNYTHWQRVFRPEDALTSKLEKLKADR